MDKPTDKVRLVVTDAATGDYFRLGTRTATDTLIFTRSKAIANAHELVMPLAEFEKMQEDFGLRPAATNHHVQIHFLVDEAAHGGADVIAALQAELAEAQERHAEGVAALAKELDEARAQSPTGAAARSLEDEILLMERAALITELLPFIEDSENDTPVIVIRRIIGRIPSPPPGFNEESFIATLKEKERPELLALAETAGIPNAATMNSKTLRKVLAGKQAEKLHMEPSAA